MNSRKDGVGLLAGSGQYPVILLNSLHRDNKRVVVAALKGQGDRSRFSAAEKCREFPVGSILKIASFFRENGVSKMILAGGVSRKTALLNLGLDRNSMSLLFTGLFGGDDVLFRNVSEIFGRLGVEVVNPARYLSGQWGSEGHMAGPVANEQLLRDFTIGKEAIQKLCAESISQAVMVSGGRILKREGRFGTDRLISSAGKEGAVLFKGPKPGQDMRFDIPAIGPLTIENAQKQNVRGIAVAVEGVLVLQKSETLEMCNRAGISLYGI